MHMVIFTYTKATSKSAINDIRARNPMHSDKVRKNMDKPNLDNNNVYCWQKNIKRSRGVFRFSVMKETNAGINELH